LRVARKLYILSCLDRNDRPEDQGLSGLGFQNYKTFTFRTVRRGYDMTELIREMLVAYALGSKQVLESRKMEHTALYIG
jgi:hypothetical protein